MDKFLDTLKSLLVGLVLLMIVAIVGNALFIAYESPVYFLTCMALFFTAGLLFFGIFKLGAYIRHLIALHKK